MNAIQVSILVGIAVYVAIQIWLKSRLKSHIFDPLADMTTPPPGSIWCEACKRTGEGCGRNKPWCDHCGGYRTIPMGVAGTNLTNQKIAVINRPCT